MYNPTRVVSADLSSAFANKDQAAALAFIQNGNPIPPTIRKVLTGYSTKDSVDSTCLEAAASFGWENVVNALLARTDIDINEQGYYNATALFSAIGHLNLSIARTLLTHGANPNIPDYVGKPPLFVAQDQVGLAAVQLLIEFGADMYATDHNRVTLLRKIYHWRPEIVAYLVENGMKSAELLTDYKLSLATYVALRAGNEQVSYVPELSTAATPWVDLLAVLLEHGYQFDKAQFNEIRSSRRTEIQKSSGHAHVPVNMNEFLASSKLHIIEKHLGWEQLCNIADVEPISKDGLLIYLKCREQSLNPSHADSKRLAERIKEAAKEVSRGSYNAVEALLNVRGPQSSATREMAPPLLSNMPSALVNMIKNDVRDAMKSMISPPRHG